MQKVELIFYAENVSCFSFCSFRFAVFVCVLGIDTFFIRTNQIGT